MPTSCNTHDYDGKLREKWFEMRPMLLETCLPKCLSFEKTLSELEQWLDRKYFNAKRIGRARRSMRILTSERRSNFDARNEIDVEELLPILWDKVKNQDDIHDTFYEQLCDITGGSCSQGRSTRLFQFLFLFDLPSPPTAATTDVENDKENCSDEQDAAKGDSQSLTTLEEQPTADPATEHDQQSPLETPASEQQRSEPEQTESSPPPAE